MTLRLARSFALAATVALSAGLAFAASPAGADPSASPSAKATDSAGRLVVATCDRTQFYSWPARDTVPSGADYPPARPGDAFHIIGSPELTNDGMTLYETSIDVVRPWGAGKHYWVESRCVNAG